MNNSLPFLFHFDALAHVMMGLIGSMTCIIAIFALKYLHGDRQRGFFYLFLISMSVSLIILVSADHILLFFASWLVSRICLTRLIQHKESWRAAQASAYLALKQTLLSAGFLVTALLILYHATDQTSIQKILGSEIDTTWALLALVFLTLSALSQSALWPFHTWLLSSCNAPTPVCAMMHAGLINGGGFLIIRFGTFILEHPTFLTVLFIFGMISALLGAFFKLIQSNYKSMLACSTLSQMGFMVAQCGLGLLPSAVAHLCWHGFFKAYLFLNSGDAAHQKRLDQRNPLDLKHLGPALLCGLAGAYVFCLITQKPFFEMDTEAFLISLIALSSTQFALVLMCAPGWFKYPMAFMMTTFFATLYAGTVYFLERWFVPMNLLGPQPLNMFHFTFFIMLVAGWFGVLLFKQKGWPVHVPNRLLKMYVALLNASQPHPSTITAHRNHYQA